LEESKRIIEDILVEAEKKARGILESAKKEAEGILQAAEISGREEKENILSAAKVEAQQRFKEKVMAARLENRHRFLLRREELLQRVFQEVKGKLEEFSKSKDYANWMEKELEKVIKELGGYEFEIEARKEDFKLLERIRENFRKKGIEIRIGSPIVCIGGFRVKTSDGRMVVDSTFERKLERVGEEARVRVAKVLFE
jgi:V/A-type H+-transporting ATPase subunit E